MPHENLTGQTIPSPCVKQCTLNEQNVCIGCWRNLEEIKQWAVTNDGIRKKVLSNIKKRQQLAEKIIPIHKRQTKQCS